MNLYDSIPDDQLTEAIAELDAKIARKACIARMLPGLEAERDRLTQSEAERRDALLCEQADVEALKHKSPLVLWLSLTDKLDARMEREECEALEAEVRWQSAHDELEAVTATIRRLEHERRSFGLCEEHKTELMARKKALVMRQNAQKADELAALDARIAVLEAKKKEVDEAFDAAERLTSLCTDAMTALTYLAKKSRGVSCGRYRSYENIDEIDAAKRNAESYIKSIRILLVTLRTELGDLQALQLPRIEGYGPVPMELSSVLAAILPRVFEGKAAFVIGDRYADIADLSRTVKRILGCLTPVRTDLDKSIHTLRMQAIALVKQV